MHHIHLLHRLTRLEVRSGRWAQLVVDVVVCDSDSSLGLMDLLALVIGARLHNPVLFSNLGRPNLLLLRCCIVIVGFFETDWAGRQYELRRWFTATVASKYVAWQLWILIDNIVIFFFLLVSLVRQERSIRRLIDWMHLQVWTGEHFLGLVYI